ncbi:hypothetical protein R0L47_13035 [Pectobacterium polonicum]|uniref:hypothetical protein n=1 Tax=Pectobacterium polonicum TaxID=2485124 RepID=UPI0010F8DFC2|nr:hypothetical protein [Pectobacterium polonicum]TKY81340.1 hypothetical protein EDI29_16485 [Pectobacterium polonicum]
MTISNELIVSLENLIVELNKSGKNETANFFVEKLRLLTCLELSVDDKIKIIEELSRCRAMAQYANFTYYEESVLDDLINIINFQLKNK